MLYVNQQQNFRVHFSSVSTEQCHRNCAHFRHKYDSHGSEIFGCDMVVAAAAASAFAYDTIAFRYVVVSLVRACAFWVRHKRNL